METVGGMNNAGNLECAEPDQRLILKAVDNVVAIADGSGVAEGEEFCHLNNEAVNNRVTIANGFDVSEGKSGGLECLQTYKRRKRLKMSCSESKVQEGSRECGETASYLSDQAEKKPYDVAVGNTLKKYSNGHWGNVVLGHLYHSLGNGNGNGNGVIDCFVREELVNSPNAAIDKEYFKFDKDGRECSQFEWFSHRLQSEGNKHADNMHDGRSAESDDRGVTKKCQRVFCNILTSEKFSLLCKLLLENFQGMKPESVFDFSVINSRMNGKAYEQSPSLFLSDIQQFWRKIQDTGNEIVGIAQSLSDMSRASYCEEVGISALNSFEDEKHVFCNQAFGPNMKPRQTEEYDTHKICSCRQCGSKAYGTDCLICDACEEMYHVSCIKPAVKEITDISWFCASCTARGIRSPHDNCVVCERLNVPKSMNNIAGEDSIPTNEETLDGMEENSNCTYHGIHESIGGSNSSNCKVCREGLDGEKIKKCSHPFCPSKYYHVRCLSSKQLNSYGTRWYCPSCLCRVCLSDRDDDKIVLCDGCDHAYHINCMEPPLTSIPRGKWFCRKCDAGIQAIHKAKKAYDNQKWKTGEMISKHDKKWKRGQELDKDGGMDMLLNAANTLNFEENLVTSKIESQRK